jgi:phosphoenolpyruvate carboxykinase (ATP)
LKVQARTTHENPSAEELRRFTEQMPQCAVTEYGNVNVQTRVTARSADSTYVVAQASSGKTMTREEFDRIGRMQDDYLRDRDIVVVDGYIGNDPHFRTSARLTIERANANIAGMQQKLYFPREDGDEPEVQVIYTPNLVAPGYPGDRVIAVDLEDGVTRVLNSDYFGESKKGGLRMWNRKVYELGGLALHAGLKVVPTADGEKVFMIIGLSGTGKTTTTFTTQNGSLPVQDDFVALMPGGKAFGTENGCFAKTFSLDPDFEPNIYDAVIKPTAYLENVYQDERGRVNFFEESYTQNGRAVFRMDDLARFREATTVGTVDHLLILNRNENIIPAVSRLSWERPPGPARAGRPRRGSSCGSRARTRSSRSPTISRATASWSCCPRIRSRSTC